MPRFVGLLVFVSVALGCHDTTAPNELTYELHTSIVSAKPMAIETSIVARNNTDRVIHVDRNICPSSVAIFPTVDRVGTPEWSSMGANAECALWAGPLALAPGDFYQFTLGGTVPSTVRDGMHFVLLDIYLGEHVRIPGGQILTLGGTVSLP